MDITSFNENTPMNHLLQRLLTIYTKWASSFSIACTDKNIFGIERFRKDFVFSSTSAIDFLAFYIKVSYEGAPYKIKLEAK